MTTAFSTPTRAVIVRRTGRDRIEARGVDTGYLLGTAHRQFGEDCDWPGWHVECGGHREQMTSVAAATELLARLASAVDGA
jgi:hypothetical protein